MTTNYQKIKSMSLDEMAELLAYMECDTCCVYGDKTDCLEGSDCFTGIKQWLQEESEE